MPAVKSSPNRFEDRMPAIPGRSCGSCTLCCQVLVIDELEKDAGTLCKNCSVGGGCKIYNKRPEVCRDFECEWLTERDVPQVLFPDRHGTLLMIDADSEEYLAVCDPKKPAAWRNPLMLKHLIAKAKEGEVVVAKSGTQAWRIYPNGQIAPWA
jgi:hypothetical protein